MKHISAILVFVAGLIAATMAVTIAIFPAPGDPSPIGLMAGAVGAFVWSLVSATYKD